MKQSPMARGKRRGFNSTIPSRSTKRVGRDAEYAAINLVVRLRDRHCQFAQGCPMLADYCDVHHVLSGGGDGLDNLVLMCRRHHDFVHLHRREAEAMGLRRSSSRPGG